MSQHDDRVSLRQMLDQAQKAVRVASGKSAGDIAADQDLLAPALIRTLEVIGEAAPRVSPEARARFSDVPWCDMIDYDLVRQIIDDDLPPLIASIEEILADTA